VIELKIIIIIKNQCVLIKGLQSCVDTLYYYICLVSKLFFDLSIRVKRVNKLFKIKSMKKLVTIIALTGVMFLFNHNSTAQEIGARFGSVVGGNVAVDAVLSLGEFSRIHADVSFGNGVGVEALWDFFYRPVDIGGENFNWYAGAGPSILISNPFYFGFSGEFGLEYHFDGVPIALGVDWRPTFWLIETTDFTADGFGFNARFVFN
jgi:hypothetical protein